MEQALKASANEILIYVDNVYIIKDIIKNMHKEIGITSPYVNFRDALFHYRKMYTEYKNKQAEQVIKQSACISEHLNRGIKDFIVYICSNCFMSGIDELPKKAVLTPDRAYFLGEIRNRLCDIILEIRLSGLSLTHFDDTENKQWYIDFITITNDFYSFLSNNNLLSIYKRMVQNLQFVYED